MISCNVCMHWRPKQWDRWHFVDERAYCKYLDQHTDRTSSCEIGRIAAPETAIAKHRSRGNAPEEEELARWYKENHPAIAEGRLEVREYQQEIIDRYTAESDIYIFTACGTGKSAVSIRIAGEKYLRGEINALLVIAPNLVHKQWAKQELPKWLQDGIEYQIQCFGGRGGSKITHPFLDDGSLQIVCVNIDTFSTPNKWKDIVEWANFMKTMIILDEATTIKSIKAQRTQRVLYAFNDVKRRGKQILSSKSKSVARAVLTGTPVTNRPVDLWTLCEFVRPNFWGRNWYGFNNYYAMHTTLVLPEEKGGRAVQVLINEEKWNAIKDISSYDMANAVFGVSIDTFNTIHSQDTYQGPYKHADELKARLDEVAVFRRLEDCADMPPQSFIRKDVVMDGELRSLYNEMEQLLIAEYNGKFAEAKSKLTAIIRLQQITSGFLSTRVDELGEDGDLLPNEITWVGKSNAKLDMLYGDIAESVTPLIVVTHFTAEASRIYDDLKDKYKCCLMTGWRKEGTVEGFQAGAYEIMIANIRVISKGLNLQNSANMFFYSNTFSLEDRLQCEGRIWRMGQENKCVYFDYAYEDTVDLKIVTALQQKRSLLDYILGVSTKEFVTGSLDA